MIFQSPLPEGNVPSEDLYSYIFSYKEHEVKRVLYIDPVTRQTLTFGQLRSQSRKFAHVLSSQLGVKPGDAIAVLAGNSLEFPIVYFGILAAGCTVAPIPVQAGVYAVDIAPRIRQTESVLLIADNDQTTLAKASADLAEMDYSRILLLQAKCTGTGDGKVKTFDTLMRQASESIPVSFNDRVSAQTKIAMLFRTSGSTGKVKSVQVSHAHWTANLDTTLRTLPSDIDPDKDVWVSSIPFSYGINAKFSLALSVMLGIPVVVMKESLTVSTARIIDDYKITFLFVTPPLAASIAKADLGQLSLKSIRWLLSAGAPVHYKIRDAVEAKFHGVPLRVEWGMTECLLLAYELENSNRKQGSSGIIVPNVECKVIDPISGFELDIGETGEICVRNRLCKFNGYRNNPSATRELLDSDGWAHTGDLGYIDAESHVYIVDRLKELIKVGDGYGLHTTGGELESYLFDHPAISMVAVVGVRNPDTQFEMPTAFVVPKDGHTPSVQLSNEIAAYLADRVSPYKRLTGGVYFRSSLPTIGFKINRQALRADATRLREIQIPEVRFMPLPLQVKEAS